MKMILQRLLISIAITIYILSALEVNVCGIENTFFDDYDTYIESKTQKIEFAVAKEKKKDADKLEFEQNSFTAAAQYYFYPILITPTYQKPKNITHTKTIWKRKIFIFHSSFLI